MKDLFNLSYVISTIVILVATVVFCFFDITVALGLLLGLIFNGLYFFILKRSITGMLDNGGKSFAIHGPYTLRLFILAFPLLIAAILPEFINIFAVLASLTVCRVSFIVSALFKRGIS